MSSDADVGDESGSRIGPTILWSMLKGKKVITNDGKDIGEIKDISDNYIRLEKGSIKKDKFWIPKYTADAYDAKHVYGDESPRGDEYTKGLQSFKNSPSGQKGEYSPGFEERIRIIENYKNIRDLK